MSLFPPPSDVHTALPRRLPPWQPLTWHPATVASLATSVTLLAFWPLDGLAIAGVPAAIVVPAALAAACAAVAGSAGSAGSAGTGAWQRWQRWTLRAWLPVAVSLFLTHGLIFPEGDTALVRLGPLAVTVEGIGFATVRAARWLAIASAVSLVGTLCRGAALAQAVETAPLPGGLGHALAAALLLAPAARRSAAQIREAQRARGLETHGSLYRRVRSFTPLVVPLAVTLIEEGQARALTLAARGYSPGQSLTYLAPLPDSVLQRRLRRVGLAAVAAGLVAARVLDAAR